MNPIVSIASQCIGIKEKPGNAGFSDSSFETDMRSVGWRPSYAWCMYSCKLWWKVTHTDPKHVALINMLTGSTQQSWEKAKRYFKTGSVPVPGAIGIMRRGEKPGFGHAFVVEDDSSSGQVPTIEGNIEGSLGEGVNSQYRDLDFSKKSKGLYLLGFIYPPGNFTASNLLLPLAGIATAGIATYAILNHKHELQKILRNDPS